MNIKKYEIIKPTTINPIELGYEESYNKQIDPTVKQLMDMSQMQIAHNYSSRHNVEYDQVLKLLQSKVQYMPWSGSDILNVQDLQGKKHKVILETNSCPSGAKDLPSADFTTINDSAYAKILQATLLPKIKDEKSDLAVIWDKNKVETRNYAQVLANLTQRDVHYVPLFNQTDMQDLNFNPHTLGFNDEKIAGAFRYVTQGPWKRISVNTSTPMTNPIIACLAGGRNKLLAAKAYEQFNKKDSDLKISLPYTSSELSKEEVIKTLKEWEYGVVKLPYSNAGQGVFTITSEKDLKDFRERVDNDKTLILQQLIGYGDIRSNGKMTPLTHIGSLVDGKRYATDIRMMVINGKHENGESGYHPVSMYARKAENPLEDLTNPNIASWDVLGTNLSELTGREEESNRKTWATHNDRRIVVTKEQFPSLDLSIEDLVDTYIQAVQANFAINEMANYLMKDGTFQKERFEELNGDHSIMEDLI